MANFVWKLWQTLIGNYGKLWLKIMANFEGKNTSTFSQKKKISNKKEKLKKQKSKINTQHIIKIKIILIKIWH
jgi:hypothetical protein